MRLTHKIICFRSARHSFCYASRQFCSSTTFLTAARCTGSSRRNCRSALRFHLLGGCERALLAANFVCMASSIINEDRTRATHLSAAELQRYSRHLIMPEVTAEGQKRLKAARVLCIGAGGLGSPAALYLAAAGVGRLGIVDFDTVDLTNLQRQILHGTKDIGRTKLESARDRLRDINPEIEIKLHECRFSSKNAGQIVANYDVVVDGSDNFATRYLSNDVCVFAGSQTFMAQYFGSRVKPPCSRRIWLGHVIAAFFRNRLRRTPSRTVHKRVCLGFFPASSACYRLLRQSSWSLASATR